MMRIPLAVLLLTPGFALAALPATESTSGAAATRGAFLQLTPGARPAGMGGAFTAVADDASAGSWNPGGLGQQQTASILAMHDVAAFGAGVSYLAGAVPAGPGAVGASVALLTAGPVDGRDENGRAIAADGVLEVAGLMSYGMALGRGLGVPAYAGVALEVHRDLAGGMAFAGGVGAVLEASPALRLGLAAQHLGPAAEGFGLPATVRGGAVWAPTRRWLAALDAAMPLGSKVARLGLGGEFWLDPRLALRAGFRRALSDQGLGGMDGLGAGLGARLGSFGLDYAMEAVGDAGWSHRISVAWLPKPKRAMMTIVLPVAANDPAAIYADAVKKYGTGDHGGATSQLSVLLNADRTHWQGWQMLGNVRAAQGDQPGALVAWKESLRLHPDNPSLAGYLASQSTPSAATATPAPSVADAAYAESVRLYTAKDYRNAWAKSAQALQADPRHWQSWQILGSCQYALNDPTGAAQSFRNSLQLNPNNPQLKSLLDRLEGR